MSIFFSLTLPMIGILQNIQGGNMGTSVQSVHGAPSGSFSYYSGYSKGWE